METAKLSRIRKNIMGTTSFEMIMKGMRKPQDFIVYPITKGESAKVIRVQSDKRWAEIDTETGIGFSTFRPTGHANSWYFEMEKAQGKLMQFQLTAMDLSALRAQIFVSADSEAGKRENGIVFTDNSGAINVLGMLE